MPGLRRPGFFNPRTPTSRPAWLHFRYRATAGIAGSGLEPLVVVFGQAVTGTSEPRRWLSKGSPRDRHGHSTATPPARCRRRSDEHTSELQSLMRISYAVFCLKKKTDNLTMISYI